MISAQDGGSTPTQTVDVATTAAATSSVADLPEVPPESLAKPGFLQKITKERLIRFAGKFHPISIHFPIALLTVAAMIELFAWVTRREPYGDAARICLWLGTLAAIPAATLGWADAWYASYSGTMSDILFLHRWFGTGTAVMAVVVLIIHEVGRRSLSPDVIFFYRVLLLICAATVGLTGYYGGDLVYGLGHLSF